MRGRRRDVIWRFGVCEYLNERGLCECKPQSIIDQPHKLGFVWGEWGPTNRMAASPGPLLSVCITHRFAYSAIRDVALVPASAKSVYASSTTTIPLKFS